MELILTTLVGSVSIVNAVILIFWALFAKRSPTKRYVLSRILALIIGFALVALTWYVLTHQVWPQWITGTGSTPSPVTGPSKRHESLADIFMILALSAIFVFGTGLLAGCATLRFITNAKKESKTDTEDTNDELASELGIDTEYEPDSEDIMMVAGAVAIVFVFLSAFIMKGSTHTTMFNGDAPLHYRQVITTNTVSNERVLYENDKGITVEIARYRGEKLEWADITTITEFKKLPSMYAKNYRVSKGYDTLFIDGVSFTEIHSVSGDIPKGLEDNATIKITKVTLVSENVSFRDGTNADIIRSSGDIQRIHIEYEVTNMDELQATDQNRQDLKQLIKGDSDGTINTSTQRGSRLVHHIIDDVDMVGHRPNRHSHHPILSSSR